MNRIPSLDGLRAISILMVIFGHLSHTEGAPEFLSLLNMSRFGVRMFFVISGFLITGLLMKEYQETGRVSLRQFYLRRTVRIFPAYWVYIAVVGALTLLGFIHVGGTDFWAAITYTTNYRERRSWWLGHSWSLSVEEQFYLIWPLLFSAVGATRRSHAAVAMLLIAPMARLVCLKVVPSWRPLIDESFPTIADTIAAGCLLALWRDWLWSHRSWRLVLCHPLTPFVVLACVAIFTHFGGYGLEIMLGETIINLLLAILIERSVRLETGKLFGLLNSPPMVWIGTLSYSLYLWQQLFTPWMSSRWCMAFPYNLFLTFGAAAISYYCIERPCLSHLRPILLRRFG